MDDEDFYREIMILRACRDTNILQVRCARRACCACCAAAAAACRLLCCRRRRRHAAAMPLLRRPSGGLQAAFRLPCPPCLSAHASTQPPAPLLPFIPQFQGACFKDDRTLLVTEYMEVRSLEVLLSCTSKFC